MLLFYDGRLNNTIPRMENVSEKFGGILRSVGLD
jgi:hypothetical protein